MRLMFALIATCISLASLPSYALSGDSLAQESIEKHQNAIQAYGDKKNKLMPEIIQYKYGMKLDVAKVVRQTPDTKSCQVIPRLMTYENSAGELMTVQYMALSECRNKH